MPRHADDGGGTETGSGAGVGHAVGVTWSPLGGYGAVAGWTAHPRSWGQDGRSRVWFAGDVLDGLTQVIDEHVAAVQLERRWWSPAALGCVPWLIHRGIAERLARLHACCIVVDKGRGYVPPVLAEATNGFPNVLTGMRDRAPEVDGGRLVLGPYSALPEYDVGPVRVVGVAGDERSRKPLLHAKLLVLGRLGWVEYDYDMGTEERYVFEPCSVWWGSANWTEAASAHLELGAWTDDRALAREATSFLDSLISFSELLVSVAPDPRPDLVSVEYDEVAMWEAMAAMEPWDEEEP